MPTIIMYLRSYGQLLKSETEVQNYSCQNKDRNKIRKRIELPFCFDIFFNYEIPKDQLKS